MPYYVYRIYKDDNPPVHMQAKPFQNVREAMAFEAEMSKARAEGDNYFVYMINADADMEAQTKAEQKWRPRL